MEEYITKIAHEYEMAEITCLFLHNKATDQCFNLLTVVELIPAEQEESLEIGTSKTSYLDRQNLDDTYTIYIGRVLRFDTNQAISIYTNADKGFDLDYNGVLHKHIDLFHNSVLEQEPPGGYPLIIDKHTDRTVGVILPYRNTDFRVWEKIDRGKHWLSELDDKTKDKLFAKAGELTMGHMGFDVSRLPEHLGNVYLCCCNPYIRKYESSLLEYNTDFLITFHERNGKTIIGKKLTLEDKRAGNSGFNIELIISNLLTRVSLPHLPDQLITKIYDTNGYLLEDHLGKWINISFGMNVQTAVLNLSMQEGDKKTVIEVPKYSAEKPVTIGKYDHSLTYYLKDQQRSKQIEELESKKEFIFFQGDGEKDKLKARAIIGEILNTATKRCMLLDPYFSAGDLYYTYIIRNLSIPIQIVSSAAFLRKKITKESSETYASTLHSTLEDYKSKFPGQQMECRVLKGSDKSPLHDRYIVTDERVYLLGSSFNEFGTRATTLIKVPVPEVMIAKAKAWWDDDSNSVTLNEFVENINKPENESPDNSGV